MIGERPHIVSQRRRFGDWEGVCADAGPLPTKASMPIRFVLVYADNGAAPAFHRNGRAARSAFPRGYYRRRHRDENFFCRIKWHRRISICYDKLAAPCLGFVQLAAVLDWLKLRF